MVFKCETGGRKGMKKEKSEWHGMEGEGKKTHVRNRGCSESESMMSWIDVHVIQDSELLADEARYSLEIFLSRADFMMST